MKRYAAAMLACLVLSACGELFEPAAATVDGDKITIDKVQEEVDDFVTSDGYKQLAQSGDAAAIKRQFEQGYLSQLIRRAVLEPEAKARGFEVSNDDVEARIAEIQADFPSQNAFEEALKEQGLTLDQLTGLVYDQLLEEGLREQIVGDLEPSEQELMAYYEENQANYRQTGAQHILVSNKRVANDVARQLQEAPPKELDDLFARLARRYSQDEASAANGGDLGFFGPGDFVPEFERAADELEIGEVSDAVRSEFGFHIIRVTDRRDRSFDEVRDGIFEELAAPAQEEAWQEWLVEIFRDSVVEVNPRYGEFDLKSQQVIDTPADSVPGAEVPAAPTASPAGG